MATVQRRASNPVRLTGEFIRNESYNVSEGNSSVRAEMRRAKKGVRTGAAFLFETSVRDSSVCDVDRHVATSRRQAPSGDDHQGYSRQAVSRIHDSG